MAADLDAVIRRALEYPYPAPPHSYLYDAARPGGWAPLPADAGLLEGRTPVLAVGSNRAPERLAQKFAERHPGARIPVTLARLRGFDSVYCAHVTSYGSIPATLHPSPGTTVTLHVTWLADDELATMHETEQPGVNYHYARLDGIDLALDGGARLDSVYAYLSVHGAALDRGAPVALAAIEATARRFVARPQAAMLAALAAQIAPGADLHDFIRANVGFDDDSVRRRESHERHMRRAVERFPFERVEVVPVR